MLGLAESGIRLQCKDVGKRLAHDLSHLFADVTHRGLPRAASESGRQPRLEKWVQRELQAVLGQQDVGVTRSFVLALVGSYGLGR